MTKYRVVSKGYNERGERLYGVAQREGRRIWDGTFVELCEDRIGEDGQPGIFVCMEHNTPNCEHGKAVEQYLATLQKEGRLSPKELTPKPRKTNIANKAGEASSKLIHVVIFPVDDYE